MVLNNFQNIREKENSVRIFVSYCEKQLFDDILQNLKPRIFQTILDYFFIMTFEELISSPTIPFCEN